MPESIEDGWTRVGGGTVRSAASASGSTPPASRYRYYLVWITELPPDAERVEIGEIALFSAGDSPAYAAGPVIESPVTPTRTRA